MIPGFQQLFSNCEVLCLEALEHGAVFVGVVVYPTAQEGALGCCFGAPDLVP